MKKTPKLLLIAVVAGCAMLFSQLQATAADSTESTFDTVKKRGYLNCIIGNSFVGFYTVDDKGTWSGMDIDICRSVAAAVFGDKEKVKFNSVQWAQSFTSIKSGAGDLLSKGMTWTLSRDSSQGLDFLDTYFYDGQGFMVRKDSGIKSALELKGATVCVLTGTSSELNLTDFNRVHNLNMKPVVFDDSSVRNTAFFNNNCDVMTNDRSGLAAARSTAPNPADYVVLPETISKEALSFAVRQNDSTWANVVKWTFAALVEAEELGITSKNIDEIRKNTADPVVKRFLGLEGDLFKGLGLPADWTYQVIKQVGNYGEVYDRNLGPNTALALDRKGTLNALWKDGGLLYSKSFR
ncbi:MAG: amino acid ABC transporter substrate-binding protein [Thermodesulfobacteriota bacterium]|nr:amino acid ABC transporter substrate-binding protein [Thermodesulfobacteriota bacterium]